MGPGIAQASEFAEATPMRHDKSSKLTNSFSAANFFKVSKIILSSQVVYRRVKKELIAVQIDSGDLFRFSPETEVYFNFLKKPQTEGSFLNYFDSPRDSEKGQALLSFLNLLRENAMLVETGVDVTEERPSEEIFAPPHLLLVERKKLDELAGVCLTTSTVAFG